MSFSLYFFAYLYVILIGTFIIARQRISITSIAFFSAILYFLPAIYPTYSIPDNAYLIYCFVLINIILTSFFINIGYRGKKKEEEYCIPKNFIDNFTTISFSMSLVFLIIQLILYGYSGFLISKTEQSRSQFLHYLWVTSISFSFILAIVRKRKIVIFACAMQYLLLLTSGDRTQIVITIIATFWVYTHTKQLNLLYFIKTINFSHIILIIVMIFVGVYGKDFYASASYTFTKGGNFLENYSERFKYRDNIIQELEPYHTQLILKKMIDLNINFNADYLWLLPTQILPWARKFGGKIHLQSEMVKSTLFPTWSKKAGVSSNFWSEGYAVSHFWGVIIFCSIFVFFMVLIQKIMDNSYLIGITAMSLMGTYWAFYIHRNSIFQIISHEKRIIYYFSAIFILTKLSVEFNTKSSNQHTDEN